MKEEKEDLLGFTDDERALIRELPLLYALDGEAWGVARADVPDKFNIDLHIGEHRYFLKHIDAAGPTTDHEKLQLEVQRHLLENDFPVPAVIATANGEHMVEWRGQKYFLQEFVGEAYDPRQKDQQGESMAVGLGRLHSLTAQSGITGWWWDYDPTFRFPVDFLDYRRRTLAEANISKAHREKVQTCLDDMGEMLADAIRQLTDAGWNDLPHIPIHGDFGHHNCRYAGPNLAAVVDFGMARMSPRSLDISKGLATALGPGADDHFPGWERSQLLPPAREDAVRWLEQYLVFAPPFDDKEARLLPLVCAANWTTWGHPPMDEQRVESCDLVAEYMRCLLNDSWDIYSVVSCD